MNRIDGGLFAVPGLVGGATRTGVKPSGSLDLAIIAADRPVPAAAMFTTCAAAAAPVRHGRAVLAYDPRVRSIVINSGNANALTGEQGDRDNEAVANAVADAVGGPVLVLSTGIIGVPLPVDNVTDGIHRLAPLLTADPGNDVAQAILTTDTTRKQSAVRFSVDGSEYTVGGIAKGSGMIHPKMATMLAVLATDAPVEPQRLRRLLGYAVDRSFHEISVDGDTSTNDAVVLLSTGDGEPLPESADAALEQAILEVARDLATAVIEDGEGMTRILDIEVTMAYSTEEARAIARQIAMSSLVKTALAGGDPNWGRILAAAGNAGVPFDPRSATLSLGGIDVYRHGEPVRPDPAALGEAFRADRVGMRLALGRGTATGRMRTTDLTHRYVEINAEYTT